MGLSQYQLISSLRPGQDPGILDDQTQSKPKPVSDEIVQLILSRAMGQMALDSFGCTHDCNELGYESLLPSLVKETIPADTPRVRIGSKQCLQPYQASFLNGSALSYGPVGKKFLLALNRAAYQGGFYQNTGEAGLSPYHLGLDIDVESEQFNEQFWEQLSPDKLKASGDVVWQLGNGYFGCRNPDGTFNPQQFEIKARLQPVKMIEIKLSQGVEPWPEMPVKKVTAGMRKIMGLTDSKQAILKPQHDAFYSPVQLLAFVQQLRELAGGKPIGIKMGISHRHHFLALCKAMRKTGILIDFLTIDGMEAGTAAAGTGHLGLTGTALNDALVFVHNALVGTRLREQIQVIASGGVFTEHQMVNKLARGANLFATARGMLLAVGCDQQARCNQGICSRGIATQDPDLLAGFDIETQLKRLFSYHQASIDGLKHLTALAGLSHPSQVRPYHIQKRISYGEVLPLDEVYNFLGTGALLTRLPWRFPKQYRRAWKIARPENSFHY